jgi:hypothetical protein
MTSKTMPEWAKPGTAVLITTRDSARATPAKVSRVTDSSVFVTSDAWSAGYERRFVPVRSQWNSASVSALEEYGRGANGFAAAARCVPAEGDEGKKILRKSLIRERQDLATKAAKQFANYPTKENAEIARQLISDWAQVTP